MLVSELEFQLFDVNQIGRMLGQGEFAHVDRELVRSSLESAADLAAHNFSPLAVDIDANEPAMIDGRARVSAALSAALREYADAGYIAGNFPRELGGADLPSAAGTALMAIFGAACTPAAGYVFLTAAAGRLIAAFGTAQQKALWLPPMLEGRWFGTMCLSEPQAGSSLLDATTQATALGNGRYSLRGNKMWISGGDHDAAENIVHMVLARIVEDGRRSEALSLFIVPRLRPDGTANGVQLLGLNKKLGHRGTTNCALAFGGETDCIGELLGEAGRGLQCMFQMMNEARIGVGTTAAATAWTAYRYASDYAFERRQGRNVTDGSSARLIDHADIRRMLLTQKAIAEGGLALCLFGASLVDQVRTLDPNGSKRARELLDLLTPVIKSWCAERGVEANSLAIQCMGGAGYVRDHPVERLYRDQRLNPIHEGTNGILAIDLIVRKASRGTGLETLFSAIEVEARETLAIEEFVALAEPMISALGLLRQLLVSINNPPGDVRKAYAFATPTALMVGDLTVSWMWLRQVRALADRRDPWADGKRAAALQMVRQIMPQSLALAPAVRDGMAPYADLAAECFAAD